MNLVEITGSLRAAVAAISLVEQLLEEQTASEEPIKVDDLVRIGAALWTVKSRAEKAVAPIKTRLREEALQQGMEGNRLRFATPEAECWVAFAPPAVRLRREAVPALKVALGAIFDLLFEEETTYRPRRDFHEMVAEIPTSQAEIILAAVDMEDSTPRVQFGLLNGNGKAQP